MIDIHSHILPGIDDGARTLADSVEIVRELESCGVTEIIATPHYVDETTYVSPRKKNQALLKELKKALAEAGVGVKIYLGNEIYMSGRILELLKAKEISPLANSKYLLVELPMSGEYPNYEDILLAVMQAGYQVILAHPERYTSVQQDYKIIEELCDTGVLLQCNIGSIMGKYGRHAKKTVMRLAKEKRIFAFGSDTHHCYGGNYITGALEKLKKYYSDAELVQVTVRNPKKILRKAS